MTSDHKAQNQCTSWTLKLNFWSRPEDLLIEGNKNNVNNKYALKRRSFIKLILKEHKKDSIYMVNYTGYTYLSKLYFVVSENVLWYNFKESTDTKVPLKIHLRTVCWIHKIGHPFIVDVYLGAELGCAYMHDHEFNMHFLCIWIFVLGIYTYILTYKNTYVSIYIHIPYISTYLCMWVMFVISLSIMDYASIYCDCVICINYLVFFAGK